MSPLPSYASGGSSGVSGSSEKASKYVGKLKAGETFEFIALTGVEAPEGEVPNGQNSIVSYDEYTIWITDRAEGTFSPSFPKLSELELRGRTDPGVVLGLKPRLRALMLVLPVADLAKSNFEAKVFAFNKSIFDQLVKTEVDWGESIRGHYIKVTRTGSTQKDTRYHVSVTPKKMEISGELDLNLVDFCNQLDSYEKIISKLQETGHWKADPESIEMPKGKGKKAKPATDEDEFSYSEEE